MKEILVVGCGGFIGSILRFKIGATILHSFPDARFPWGTWVVNVAGCLLVGLIAAALERVSFYNAEFRLLLITGFLGGFTTFSAFGLETVHLIKTGDLVLAAANVLATVTIGLTAVWCGMWLGQRCV